MVQIDIRGIIVPDEDHWIYAWFGIDATAPKLIRKSLADANGDEVRVVINSTGGDVAAGDEIYTLIRSYSGRVVIQIHSFACSAAAVIAMAAESEMSPVAQLMIHNVSSYAQGDNRAMEHAAGVLANANRALAAAFRAKTGKTEEEILDMMNRETWLTAEQAVAEGFVDRVMFADSAKATATPVKLAASYGPAMLPERVLEYARAHFNNQTAKARANAEYEILLLEGKSK